jgi:probable HAF family extracellular repeat protein
MVGLGDLPGGSFSSVAVGVSSDGSVVVGVGNSASGNEAFRWTQAEGMRRLYDVLVND